MSLSEIRVNTTKTRTGVGTITYTETGPVITGIATASNFKTGSTNVHSTGVELANINTGGSTATFGGAISGTSATLSGALSGTTASFSGTVSIGGTLTYEDVTNIDSVGIITARAGIIAQDDVTFTGATSGRNIKWDKSNDYLMVNDNARIVFGNSGDLSIRHLSSDNKSYVSSTTNDVVHEFNKTKSWSLLTTAAEKRIVCPAESTDKSVELYWNGSKKLYTTNTGAVVTGILTATTFSGALNGGVTTTDACQTGDLTILNGNPDLRLKDSNHGGNNTEHMITFQDSSGNNQMNIGSPFGEQHLRIKHNTTDLVKIQTDGKVGLGEASPDRHLHIKSPGQIKLESTDTGNWLGISFLGSSGTNNYDAYMGLLDSNGLFFIDNNSNGNDFMIAQNGKVYIGADATEFSDAGTFLNLRNNTFGGRIGFSNNTATAGVALMEQFAYWGTNKVSGIIISAGTDTTNKDDANMSFYTASSGTVHERLNIKSTGELRQYGFAGTADTGADDLTIGNTDGGVNRGMTIWSNSSQNGSIAFADNNANFRGAVQYLHNGDEMRFLASNLERYRITQYATYVTPTTGGDSVNTKQAGRLYTLSGSTPLDGTYNSDTETPLMRCGHSFNGTMRIWMVFNGDEHHKGCRQITHDCQGTYGYVDFEEESFFHTNALGPGLNSLVFAYQNSGSPNYYFKVRGTWASGQNQPIIHWSWIGHNSEYPYPL